MTLWHHIENLVTLLCTVALILGAMKLGLGGWSFFGLALMLNINYSMERDVAKPTDGIHGTDSPT